MLAEAMLEVRALTKQFEAVRALNSVDLQFSQGEIHSVVGENGAGKSTLVKILSGLHSPTSGEVLLEGKPLRLTSVSDALKSGITMIHQELNLVDELTAAENIFLGKELRSGISLDSRAMNDRAAELLKEVAAPFPPDTPVGELSIAGKQLVEIAKALSYEARVMIMDEPTAVLSEREASALFRLIRRLKENGVTVIYISHLLPEVLALSDRITVLRDGEKVATIPAAEADEGTLARMMVGRELQDLYPERPAEFSEEVVLRAENLTVEDCVFGLSLEIRKGEILGLAGLVGSGRTEAAEAIAGLRHAREGVVDRRGHVGLLSPAQAVRSGLAYVSEDRKATGLHLTLSTRENITLANLKAYANPILKGGQQRDQVTDWVKRLNIRVGDTEAPVSSLSGGNQQKVLLAKWLDTAPEVLLLDEPTRGVDIGSKQEIYQLISNLAKEGKACLVISSEMQELIGLCHRILVLRNGRLMGELTGEDMTEEKIMMLAAGVEEPAA